MKYFSYTMPLIMPASSDGTVQSWKLFEDYKVVINGWRIVVPIGFLTDGASIPRWLWRVCGTPMDIPRVFAAIVHDYLYSGAVNCCTRAEADRVYRDMQIRLGVSRIRAYVEWIALRLFGGSHWTAQEGVQA